MTTPAKNINVKFMARKTMAIIEAVIMAGFIRFILPTFSPKTHATL